MTDTAVETITVPLRDGTLTVADVHRPAGAPDAPRPVLLERTPYGRAASRASDQEATGDLRPDPARIARTFTEAGFTVVRQDTRGRGDSGGAFVKYRDEAEDGADTIAWIAAQPWCDGRVAMTGVSYSAHAQLAAATRSPAALRAMIIDSGGFTSGYDAGIRKGGAFELKQLTWAIRNAAVSPAAVDEPWRAAPARDQDAVLESYRMLPWRAGSSPLRALPDYEDYVLEQWRRQDFSEFWDHPSINTRPYRDRIPDVPVHILGSWYDPYIDACLENFRWMQRDHRSPTRIIIGPWTHGHRCETFAGDVDFGAGADFSRRFGPYSVHRARWLRAVLGEDPADDAPAVAYFLMGGGPGGMDDEGRLRHGGRWLTAGTWPPEGTRPLALRLEADGSLVAEDAEHPELAERRDELAEGPAELVLEGDPDHPVPTIGGQVTSGEPIMRGGAFDQVPDERLPLAEHRGVPLAARDDVLVFRSPVLAEPMAIAGRVTVELDLVPTTPDADVTVKLVDEHPPGADHPGGFAMNLTDTILRLRNRNGAQHPAPLVPGEPIRVTISAPDTANLFAAGHRVRLDIASSSFPRFDVNPNTGQTPAEARHRRRSRITIRLGQRSSSRLHLDVLPAPED